MFSAFWLVGQFLALVAGDWWRLVDPFDTIAGFIGAAAPEREATDANAEPDDRADADWWLPGLLLASFTWLASSTRASR